MNAIKLTASLLVSLFVFTTTVDSYAASADYVFKFRKHREKVFKASEKLKGTKSKYKNVTSLRRQVKGQNKIFNHRWKLAMRQLKAAEWAREQISSEGKVAQNDATNMFEAVATTLAPTKSTAGGDELMIPSKVNRCWRSTKGSIWFLMSSSVYWGIINVRTLAQSTFGPTLAALAVPVVAIGIIFYPIYSIVKDIMTCRKIPAGATLTSFPLPDPPGAGGLVHYVSTMSTALKSGNKNISFTPAVITSGPAPSQRDNINDLVKSYKLFRGKAKRSHKRKIKKFHKLIKETTKEELKVILGKGNQSLVDDLRKELVKAYDDIPGQLISEWQASNKTRPFWYGVSRSMEFVRGQTIVKTPSKPVNTGNQNNQNTTKVPPKPDEELAGNGGGTPSTRPTGPGGPGSGGNGGSGPSGPTDPKLDKEEKGTSVMIEEKPQEEAPVESSGLAA